MNNKKTFLNKAFIIVAITLFLYTPKIFSQGKLWKWKATSYSICFKNENNKWDEWPDLKETDLMITIDTNQDKITIYANDVHKYDIAKYEDVRKQTDGTKLISLFCIDKFGAECEIKQILDYEKKTSRIFIFYDDMKVLYNCYMYESK